MCLIGVTWVIWLEICELWSMTHLGGRLGGVSNPVPVHAIKVEGRMQTLVLNSPTLSRGVLAVPLQFMGVQGLNLYICFKLWIFFSEPQSRWICSKSSYALPFTAMQEGSFVTFFPSLLLFCM